MLISQPQHALRHWLCERVGYVPTKGMVCLGQWDNDAEELIAVAGFDGWSGHIVELLCAGTPGRHWLSKDMLVQMFRLAFIVKNVNIVITRVSTNNAVSLRATEKVGFTEQCRLKDGADDGDLIIYGLYRDECRWLNVVRAKREAA